MVKEKLPRKAIGREPTLIELSDGGRAVSWDADAYFKHIGEAQDRIDYPQSEPPKTKEEEREALGKKRIRYARPGNNY